MLVLGVRQNSAEYYFIHESILQGLGQPQQVMSEGENVDLQSSHKDTGRIVGRITGTWVPETSALNICVE